MWSTINVVRIEQVEDLTEKRDVLNIIYTISLFLENMVSSNIEISQVRHVPISSKHIFKQKVASGPGG